MQVFNYFLLCLDLVVMVAKKEGQFNEGFVDLTGASMQRKGEVRRIFEEISVDSRYHAIASLLLYAIVYT